MEAEQMMMVVKITFSVISTGFLALLFHLYNVLVLKPKRHISHLQNQGIRGPPPSFMVGNIPEIKRIRQENHQSAPPAQQQSQSQSRSNFAAVIAHDWFSNVFPHLQRSNFDAIIAHDWPSNVFPHLQKWRDTYGPVFVYSSGNIQFLCISDIELVKEISLYTSLNLGKPSYLSKDRGPLLGQGILTSSGQIWSHQRNIIAPQFYLDKVKKMVHLMVEATISTLKSWESRIESQGGGVADIKIDDDLRSLSGDVISRACFGSSYCKGEEIFSNLRTLQKTMSKGYIGIPGSRYMPTKNNREIWKLEKEIDSMILEVVNQRIEQGSQDKDLLQMIVEGAESYGISSNLISRDKFIVDNCKNIYFAGHETTAITASWCLMLLSAYPEWQDRVRAEVLEICKQGFPDANMLRRMKTLTMVIQETLRLYPPAVFVIRQALEDIKFKDIVIPGGMNVQIPIPALQQNTDLWGSDAHIFNPERFSNGINGACKFPQAYIPFGTGSRTCLGQNFAMIELKVILSLILSKFSFSLSPAYYHMPAFRLVVEPDHGVCLQIRKL
ncbi:hypothetical protein EZV62_009467 [Acer yangbiense]|uniref:Cytochrome P450 n=1 Tax=Acer yangbiense TaxID=1000413 RepID=A0A5C7HZ62_9ROSI|nr:hypothetical protein EZV62_009467 [Acer yangbiense]